tara:strand:+ start:77 stop:643 length:567 start_codon:yes stop_codon:yes gene_type:complete
MPLTTYTAGEVLTAASLNSNFSFASTNGGLVLVSATTIGSAVSSVTISSAFSATYDAYKIVVSGGVGSANGSLQLQLGSTTSGYYGGFGGSTFAGAGDAGGYANTANFQNVGRGSTNTLQMSVELQNPFDTKNTYAQYSFIVNDSAAGRARMTGAFLNNSTSYTAFTIVVETGTLTGGTVAVYGYAKA